MKKNIVMFVFTVLLTAALGCQSTQPENIILCIGDGMGPQQVKAAGIYANGKPGTLIFESFPNKTFMTTHSANQDITDSGASATAMATGRKVNNGVISMQIPGDGADLETSLEFFMRHGKAAGVVTTTPFTDATPASFIAHVSHRYDYNGVAADILTQSKPNVFMGSGGARKTPRPGSSEYAVGVEDNIYIMNPKDAADAGYTVVNNLAELQQIDTEATGKLCGQFGRDFPYEVNWSGNLPHLSQMVTAALNILDNDPDGFFLMVEAGKIDWSGHENNLAKNVAETVELDKTLRAILKWAKGRKDTLIIVTADHETGGLKVTKNNGKGKLPSVTWSTKGHTTTKVPVFAYGPGSELFEGEMDNTDIYKKIMEAAGVKEPALAAN